MSSLRSLIAKAPGEETGVPAAPEAEPVPGEAPQPLAAAGVTSSPVAGGAMPVEEGAAKTLQQMLDLLGIDASVAEPRPIDDGVLLEVHSPEAGRLIGRGGIILQNLQFLLNRIAQRTLDPSAPRFVLDIDGYRQRLQEKLVRQARQAADRVRRWGEPVLLEPMTAYERRIVHTALKGDPDVETWSPPEADADGLKQITVRPAEVMRDPAP